MKVVIAIVVLVTLSLAGASEFSVASAETTTTTATAPTSPPPRTVAVEGVANISIEPAADAAVANTTYRQAMAAAIADGQSKAQFLAEKSSAALGAVQSIGEGGGYIQCPGELEYQGAQPDFGQGAPIVSAGSVAAASPRAVVRSHRVSTKHRKRHKARKATAQTCTLSTQVALVYALN